MYADCSIVLCELEDVGEFRGSDIALVFFDFAGTLAFVQSEPKTFPFAFANLNVPPSC
jgi:hypothetical protein